MRVHVETSPIETRLGSDALESWVKEIFAVTPLDVSLMVEAASTVEARADSKRGAIDFMAWEGKWRTAAEGAYVATVCFGCFLSCR